MAMCVIGPVTIFLWRRLGGLGTAVVLACVLVPVALGLSLIGGDVLADMLSTEDPNNAIKLGYLSNFAEILRDPLTLSVGRLNAHVVAASSCDASRELEL
jgi:hypothetical protein